MNGAGNSFAVCDARGLSPDYAELAKRLCKLTGADGLLAIDNIVIYGDTEDTTDRVGVVSFNTPDINTHVLAKRLASSYAVATRRGAFCAHPYVWRLMNIPDNDVRGFLECVDVNTAGMLRVSFGIYNTEEEVEEFLQALPEAIKLAQADAEFYSRAEPAY